ncbi:hypothetical protein GCM10027271_47230 [Saccharopolyspora gloriosae]
MHILTGDPGNQPTIPQGSAFARAGTRGVSGAEMSPIRPLQPATEHVGTVTTVDGNKQRRIIRKSTGTAVAGQSDTNQNRNNWPVRPARPSAHLPKPASAAPE